MENRLVSCPRCGALPTIQRLEGDSWTLKHHCQKEPQTLLNFCNSFTSERAAQRAWQFFLIEMMVTPAIAQTLIEQIPLNRQD